MRSGEGGDTLRAMTISFASADPIRAAAAAPAAYYYYLEEVGTS
jgi:hypothetical protein